MVIRDDHIREAEKLLINGDRFDSEERIPFIKNLNSCDLLAVPGSGKTTALLAKLYCLSKLLPFTNGSGILVLAHTNAAVNEIEKNLKPHCPKLFEYPNFVGTIQSFVNKFLANPACINKYGSYIVNNDNNIYEREATKFYYSLEWKSTEPKGLVNKLCERINYRKKINKKERTENVIKFLKYFELDIINRKILYDGLSFYKYSGTSQLCYLELEKWKEKLFSKGILNYRDSYYLADWYVANYPLCITIIQSRFKYIFIDEMQDLEKFQIDIIDKVFMDEGSPTVMQRIGDINQAIYNSSKEIKVDSDWKPRNPILYLTGSNRLTPNIANIVNGFTLDRQQNETGQPRFVVNGLRQLGNKIEPHLILFNSNTIDLLEGKFKELIIHYSLQEIAEALKYGFKIIGWASKWDDDENHNGKLRLENIFQAYKKETNANKETFDSLSKYIQLFDYNKITLESARMNILNLLIHILRIENKTYKTKIRDREVIRYYSKSEMINYIKSEENNCNYELFKRKLYKWSFKLAVNKSFVEVYSDIKDFIETDFKDWFNFSISTETSQFMGDQFEPIITIKAAEEDNTEDYQIRIDIGTVHSAKGQTHCATMYVETAYQRPPYETNKIIKRNANPFLQQRHNCTRKFEKQSIKMMYVGFSRPTHLLCFAALKENIGDNCQPYIDAGWKIEDLTVS